MKSLAFWSHVCFVIFLFLLTLGQLQRLQVTPNVAIYAHDIFLAGWCGISFLFDSKFRQKVTQTLRQFRHQKELLFFLWVGIGILIALFRHEQIISAVFYFIRLGVYAVFGVLLLDLVQRKILSKATVLLGFLLYGVFILYFGLLQYAVMPDTRWLFFLGWDDHYYRLISTLFDPGFTGIILVLTFCATQAFQRKIILGSHYQTFFEPLFQHLKHQNLWLLKVVVSILLSVGILLTYSRASYLAFLVAVCTVAVYSFWRKKPLKQTMLLVFYLLFFLVSIPFLPHPGGEGVNLSRTSTVYARTTGITAALQQMKPLDWVVGHGLFVESAKPSTIFQEPDHAHIQDNWIVFILSGTGVIGLILFMVFIWKLIVGFYQKNIWLAVSVVVIFIHGLFNASVVYPFVFLFLIGLVVALT